SSTILRGGTVPVARDALRGDDRTATHPEPGSIGSNTRLAAMPVETNEKQDVNRAEAGRNEKRSPGENGSVEPGAKQSQTTPSPDRQSMRRRRLLIGVLGAVVLAAVCLLGIPWIRSALNTVSTDDAYVNGHVTFVAPRVSGQISRVLVDDNYRIQKGEL